MRHPSGVLLPDFIGIGPPRTGTTWLHKVLGSVVVLPHDTKETRFFSTRYQKGIAWYADHFRHAGGDLPIGEFDPNFFIEEAIDRIHQHLPDCRLICTMRDPVDRAYSLYKHLRRMGRAQGDFVDWAAHLEDGNRYAEYLMRWRERFGSERIMVTVFDDLERDPQSYLNTITDFIGASPVRLEPHHMRIGLRNHVAQAPSNENLARLVSRLRQTLQEHRAYGLVKRLSRLGFWAFFLERGEPYRPLSPEVERLMRERLRPQVEALEDLLGRELGGWKVPPDRSRPDAAAALSARDRRISALP